MFTIRLRKTRLAALFATAVALLGVSLHASADWVTDADGLTYFKPKNTTTRYVTLHWSPAAANPKYNSHMIHTNMEKYIIVKHREMVKKVNVTSGVESEPEFANDSTLGTRPDGYYYVVSEADLNSIKEVNWDNHIHSIETVGAKKKLNFTTSIGGIEYFKNVELISFQNSETNAVVNKNSATMTMGNEISSVDLSHNPRLKVLRLGFNNLKTIDLSNNPELVDLELSTNSIEAIDISHNPRLVQFDLSQQGSDNGGWLKDITVAGTYNDLKIVDVANGVVEDATMQGLLNRARHLLSLDARSCNITSLDFSVVPSLQHLFLMKSAYGARQTYKGAWCHTLDLSPLTDLRSLYVNQMHLNSLKIYSPHYGENYVQKVEFALEDGNIVQREVTARAENNTGGNYRTIDADLVKWEKNKDKPNQTYHYAYFLRLVQTDSEFDGGHLLEQQSGYYDRYFVGESGEKTSEKVEVSTSGGTMTTDGFELEKVTGWYPISGSKLATSTTKDVYTFTVGETPLEVTTSNAVKGAVIVLSQGESTTPFTTAPADLPVGVAYDYSTIAPGVTPAESGNSERYTARFNLLLNYPPIGGITTGVDNMEQSRQVSSVTYVNAAGVMSSTPHDGFNIVVTRYDDGTRSTTRVMK